MIDKCRHKNMKIIGKIVKCGICDQVIIAKKVINPLDFETSQQLMNKFLGTREGNILYDLDEPIAFAFGFYNFCLTIHKDVKGDENGDKAKEIFESNHEKVKDE